MTLAISAPAASAWIPAMAPASDLLRGETPEQRENRLFRDDPLRTAAPLIEAFAQRHAAPFTASTSTELNNLVSEAMGLPMPPDAGTQDRRWRLLYPATPEVDRVRTEIVEKIEKHAGLDARVMPIPLVLANETSGVTQTVVFEVRRADGQCIVIDDRASQYVSFDQFLDRNHLDISTRMVMPAQGAYQRDADHRLLLSVRAARSEGVGSFSTISASCGMASS